MNLCVVLNGFGISVFGLQTRNFHPRGSWKGVLKVKDGSTGGQSEEGRVCMGWGREWAVPLFFVSYSPPSLMCSAAPAVGLLTYSLRVTQAGV